MAEDIRNIEQILKELFDGKDAALEKYAKVRHVQYEMNLWRRFHLPLSEVNGQVKVYFSKRFLGGERIIDASEATLKKGFESLDHAVKDGCRGRCRRLVEELNEALVRLNLRPIAEIDRFLDWLTFDSETVKDYYGEPAREYGFPVLVFHDKENRKDFWNKTKVFLKRGVMISMQDVARIILIERRAVRITREGN